MNYIGISWVPNGGIIKRFNLFFFVPTALDGRGKLCSYHVLILLNLVLQPRKITREPKSSTFPVLAIRSASISFKTISVSLHLTVKRGKKFPNRPPNCRPVWFLHILTQRGVPSCIQLWVNICATLASPSSNNYIISITCSHLTGRNQVLCDRQFQLLNFGTVF